MFDFRDGPASTYFVDHIAFGMPALVPRIPVNFDELFQDCAVATHALGREASRVVIVTVDIVVVLIVRILRAKEGCADRTCKMLYVVFFVCWEGIS